MSLRVLDLFAGAGGMTRGFQRAGFDVVVGVDIADQPHYCGDEFIRADVLTLSPEFAAQFDFVHASPPCQRFTALRHAHNAKRHVDLIGPARELLIASGKPYSIENVAGAPLLNPTMLCGSMFGLATPCGAELRRHRLFETSFSLLAPQCQHRAGAPTIGIYGGHFRNRRRPTGTNHQPETDFSPSAARLAMDIDWTVTGDELSQMVPPAFGEFIARAWLSRGAR